MGAKMLYKDILNELPPIIYLPRFNLGSNKKLKPIKYFLIIHAYRREIGYYRLTFSSAGSLIIKDKLISFYDDELINSIEKIKAYLVQENLIDSIKGTVKNDAR